MNENLCLMVPKLGKVPLPTGFPAAKKLPV